ncbi:LysR family transcriptional regulator [Salinivibrio kushneri]|uniref:HTH-type transcriptional regulator MetR n=1 Tax=Salinivibrio kushneri TaxID=1908198 RepID=A0AB36JWL8_9GAMM|nr:LysR family transcriptional regulator [Salinivibrio kushneri]OOE38962.1 LysR family transcriptional regulator [Salinivibrio kushneri]QCP02801.1 LysR family transcriptional regulator [Salinivibrio kushneri]
MLERHHLHILRAIKEQGSLTAAAETLYLTQSAISHAMKKLESQLGISLWQKSGRQLHFTRAGEYLLTLSERMLPQFEHAEQQLKQFAQGQRGTLRIGMECHPCYQWLLKVVEPFLHQWPDVDVDVKQKFQFGGLGALFGHEIDVLVTPDPLLKPGIEYVSVFDYEQVLVVSGRSALAAFDHVDPQQVTQEVLITYPVDQSRLDVFTQFLAPAHCAPRKHKTIETTDIMLQMVAAERGIAALPKWLAKEYQQRLNLHILRIGQQGIHKSIHLGVREGQRDDYIQNFIEKASSTVM